MLKITDDTARRYGWRDIKQWRKHWERRLGLSTKGRRRLLTPAMLLRLEHCADDAARKVLLGP